MADMSKASVKVGYLGTGLMGAPMARRLVKAGYDVQVWNRSRDKMDALVAAGAHAAATPKEIADTCDVVFMCLTDTRAVDAVVFGDSGISQGNHATTLVDFSTIPPDTTRDIAARLKSANGMAWVDAPVSGGVPGAEDGTLAIMAGGDASVVEAVTPLVNHMSARFTRMGEIGAGQATKLCNQIISGCTITVVAEAVNFAQKSGVDASALTEALKGGFADSIPFQLFAPRMAARDFENPMGATNTMIKDLNTVAEVAVKSGARLVMTEQALGIMNDASAHGDGEADISTIIRRFED
ncbi:MAG: NAD(P)-dependent oxidoreductase [Alphaproteobacteria bacterium]|jgi:3-hydroxyisobutyrate dehydrogenase|nr:NAD(P)-dependent oxidoreductase [Alphaproteobacteria bacterium]MBT4016831.1 NAD(P)-dependent oxidoreductase [Alphaproteobacteria bacterium]MBT5161023.1 NAD(P)-dependent oxidoreductase [Alphaproteobacteria bacterium]MBT5918562.1 NAD(P)-dependent oxidoreductase [Alphaproteobacteria bacterium]MBT6386005.1 NAD(P)-dependent oxidoreductase [Alphaproteobacteria bacterium]